MRRVWTWVLGLAIMMAIPAAAAAQFGHPLQGSWSGGWGPNQEHRLLLNFHWTGSEITGVINPGPNAATVTSTTIDFSDPAAWKVTMTAEVKDASGTTVPITIDGTLENIGVYYKLFRGTWTQGGEKGAFIVTRN